VRTADGALPHTPATEGEAIGFDSIFAESSGVGVFFGTTCVSFPDEAVPLFVGCRLFVPFKEELVFWGLNGAADAFN
jgi:hypothetical protein